MDIVDTPKFCGKAKRLAQSYDHNHLSLDLPLALHMHVAGPSHPESEQLAYLAPNSDGAYG